MSEKNTTHVLIVDDDDIVREMLRAYAQVLGYEVTVASDGPEALCTFKKWKMEGKCFDLIVIDFKMPGDLSGVDVLRCIHQMDASVKAILISGYASDEVMQNCHNYGFKARIPKPFTIDDFRQTIDNILSTT